MIPLADLHAGSEALVHSFKGGHKFIARLAVLGFTLGAPLTIMRNHGFGPMIVNIRGTRVALGRDEARKIIVRPTEVSLLESKEYRKHRSRNALFSHHRNRSNNK